MYNGYLPLGNNYQVMFILVILKKTVVFSLFVMENFPIDNKTYFLATKSQDAGEMIGVNGVLS